MASDIGGLSVYVLLSLVNKEIALAFDRTAAQIDGVAEQDARRKKQNQADAMKLRPKMDIGQNLPSKPPPHGATHINRNGLIKM